jgi:hypothetical protein
MVENGAIILIDSGTIFAPVWSKKRNIALVKIFQFHYTHQVQKPQT